MEKDIGIVKKKYFQFAHPPNMLKLVCGKKLGPITVAYETYGKLNKDKSNAILICHALTGSAHAAGWHKKGDRKPGWWNNAIGPGKMFDTNKYFVISSNCIGGCKGTTGPSSENPKTGLPYALSFPIFTIKDMVNVQKALIDHLGIKKLLSVVGGSMGGMQAIKWALLYPKIVKTAIVIAACAKLTPQGIAFNAAGRHAIISDPNWNNGNYYGSDEPTRGLAVARMIGHITYLSDKSMHTKFGRRLQEKKDYGYDFTTDFQVESYLDYQGRKFVERFDANSYLYMTKAVDYFDLEKDYGSLEKAFQNVLSKFLIISFTSDWLFPTYQSKEIVNALIHNGKEVTFTEIESGYGHDAFLLEVGKLYDLISNFLKISR